MYLFRLAEDLVELRVYNDRTLREEEQDACYSVAAEMSGDFVRLDVRTKLLVDTLPPPQQSEEGLLVYHRYEYLVFDE